MTPPLFTRSLRRKSRKVGPELTILKLERPRDWSEQYPDVPKPGTGLSVQLIAARWVCHDLYGEDMPHIAADLIEAGHDSAALRRLAAETEAECLADVEPLVARLFRDFNIPYPLPDEQAQLVFARQIAREVIAGHRDPWSGAYDLEKAVSRRRPKNADLASIFSLNDEGIWDGEYQRFVPVSTVELIEVLARIGKLTDEEIFSTT